MAEKRAAENKVFEFLTPEEQDNIIKRIIKSTHARGGTQKKAWTDYAINIRRQVILDLLGQGLSYPRIEQELMARWECGHTSVCTYYKDAVNYLSEGSEEYKEHIKEIMVHKLESLAEDALAHNDRKSALSAYEQINKLNNLYVNKVEADVKDNVVIRFDFGN